MWDTCTSHFGPKKFDRVGRGGQGRSKYGTFGSLQWEMCTNALFWPSLTPPANPVKFFWSKIPLYPYNVKTQKTHFLKILEWADFDLLESNCRHIFLHKNQKIYHRYFFFSWCMFSSHVSTIHFFRSCWSWITRVNQTKHISGTTLSIMVTTSDNLVYWWLLRDY